MAVAAAEQQAPLDEEERERVKAYAAATDNVGLFFGEDIFFAIGSIVLIQQTLEAYDIILSPLELAVWAIPTAIAAFMIHSTRLLLLDRRLSSLSRSDGDHPKGGGGANRPMAPPPRSASRTGSPSTGSARREERS